MMPDMEALQRRLTTLRNIEPDLGTDVYPITEYAAEQTRILLDVLGISYGEGDGPGLFPDPDEPGGIRVEAHDKHRSVIIRIPSSDTSDNDYVMCFEFERTIPDE